MDREEPTLVEKLAEFFTIKFDELPMDIQDLVSKNISVWDVRTASERAFEAEMVDFKRTPDNDVVDHCSDFINKFKEFSLSKARDPSVSEGGRLMLRDVNDMLNFNELEKYLRGLAQNGSLHQTQVSYETKYLKVLKLAISEFYEHRRSSDPKGDEVRDWVKNKCIEFGLTESKNMVDAIFTIIKPDDHNPRKKRG